MQTENGRERPEAVCTSVWVGEEGGWNLGIVCVPSLIVAAGKQNSILSSINSSCESVTEGKKQKHTECQEQKYLRAMRWLTYFAGMCTQTLKYANPNTILYFSCIKATRKIFSMTSSHLVLSGAQLQANHLSSTQSASVSFTHQANNKATVHPNIQAGLGINVWIHLFYSLSNSTKLNPAVSISFAMFYALSKQLNMHKVK